MRKVSGRKRERLPAATSLSDAARQERLLAPVLTCNRLHHHRRVRPRSNGTHTRTGCATAATAVAVVVCGLVGGSLQGIACAASGITARIDPVAAAFITATSGRTRFFPSSSESRAPYSSESVVKYFSHRRFIGATSGSGYHPARIHLARRSRSAPGVQASHRGSQPAAPTTAMRLPSDGIISAAQDSCGVSPSQQSEAGSPPRGRTSTAVPQLARPACPSPPESAAAAAAATAAATRFDFLRQGTAAAFLVAGAATSGLVLPERPAAASLLGRSTPASTAAAAGGLSPANDMIWLDENSGTVSTRLSQADETYRQGFVAYLARFLLNYDEGCREYFNCQLDVVVPKRDGSHVWDEFRGFAASVGLGLHRFQGAAGARELCESLSAKYASGERGGAHRQLAMLFSLLPPDVQPVPAVKSLLGFPAGGAARLGALKPSTEVDGLDLSSLLAGSPNALFPKEMRPVYDEVAKAFYVPGVSWEMSENEIELALGTRGPFPISKERSLTAVDFALFAACGAVGCTSTHTMVIPLDVVKTRLQTNPGSYEGLAEGVVTIAREEGLPMLMKGLGPTLAGYFWYGITVYPGYELFKRLFIELVGPLNAALFRVPLVLAAGASATCFACIGVCPAEAVRIRQVADPDVGNMPSAIKQIVAESGWGKLYDGLPSILFRQISFGMMKFLVFDFFTDFAYDVLPYLAEQTSTRLAVSLTSGLVAGVCAAIVSQPADTVLSTMNRDPGRATIANTIRDITDERGLGGLFLGLPSRIVWSGAIISGQFLLYDVCKTALHVSSDDLRVFLDVIASAGL